MARSDDAAAKARLGTDGCALPTVLYVGSLTQRKNVDGLLSLAERLTTSRRVRFRIVGGTAASFSSRSGPGRAESSTVELLGQVNDQQALRSIYRDASVFVFPSFYEASPLPPIEAMSAGVPVVAADIPSLRERCGDAALFVDPYDLDGLERAVVELLDDEARRRDLGERGRAPRRDVLLEGPGAAAGGHRRCALVKIVAWPARKNADRNPYQRLLYDAVEAHGVRVCEFSPSSVAQIKRGRRASPALARRLSRGRSRMAVPGPAWPSCAAS